VGIAAATAIAPDVEDPALLAQWLVASVAVDRCLVPAANPADFAFLGKSYLIHGVVAPVPGIAGLAAYLLFLFIDSHPGRSLTI
jgi:hypothetical protein